jgi:predicted DsbA family dithiol-disulfide isomerase
LGEKKQMDVAPGTIVVYADIACPWAHLAVFRLHRARLKLRLEAEIKFDHRAFPLELFNERPTPKKTLDAESRVIRDHDPDAGWAVWNRPDFEYPVTSLPALEAVQAAKEQSLTASEELDLALRRALFEHSRTISMQHVIVAAAEECPGVDAVALVASLNDGRARRTVIDQRERAESDDVKGSPHIFLPDGTSAHNPGIKMEWGEHEPVIHEDRPEIYFDLLQKAAGIDQPSGGK